MESTSAPISEISAPTTPSVVSEAISTPVVESPVEATAPATETPATPSSEPVTESILGDSKPDSVKKTIESPKEENAPESKTEIKSESELKPELPVYEPFKLPDNISIDQAPMQEFTKILGEIETGKLDHAGYQEMGQKLVDLATKATQESIERLNDYYVQIHEQQKQDWLDSFKNDPDIGGKNLETTVGNLRNAVESYGGNESQIAEFRELMKTTGVGNHPALIRVLNNMDAQIRKYTTEADNGNGGSNRMVPAAKPAPSKVKDYQRFYGN